jgi:EpsI family protein
MSDWRIVLVPLFLLAQAPMVHWAVGHERAPEPPVLQKFPQQLGDWKQLRDEPVALDVGVALQADRILNRAYLDASTGRVASLFVGWFQSERGGRTQPHSPKWCLPASGWTPVAANDVNLNTAAGTITVNRYIVAKQRQRIVVLYWYQGPSRVTAGEWETKFWQTMDALRSKRTDTAVVRVVVLSDEKSDQAATAVATDFGQRLYPLLRKNLPL